MQRDQDMIASGAKSTDPVLRGVGLIAANEPPEQPAGLRGNADRQQEMSYHRHPVPAQDEPLNVAELERAPRGRTGPGITFVLHAPEQAPKKSLASPRRPY